MMERCADIMTKNPVCCLPNENVETAARHMTKEDVGSIPVIEDQQTKKLLGIITDRDLVLKIMAEGKDTKSSRVAEFMSRNPVTCHMDSPLEEALRAMCDHQIRRIPVVDGHGSLVGIISQADVAVRYGETGKTGLVVKEISKES